MKKTYLKLLLTAVGLLVGSGAWAGDKTVVKYSFDDASSPAVTAGSRVSLDYTRTSVITNTKFLNAWNNTNGDPGASTISLGSTDLSEETWTLSFEWAAVGGCNSKADHTTLKAGDVSLFDLSGNSNWNTTVTLSIGGTATATTLPVPGCDKSTRFTAATGGQMNTNDYWHHIVITGSSEGVKLTITNSNSGDAVVTDVVLSETNVNPTSLIIEPCCGGAIGIDELSLSYYVAGEVIQTPVAAYTAVDGINRTITATCDTEGTTLYYSTDGENWTEGAQADVNASGNIYFKAVKGTSESDVLTFAAEAGTAIVLNAPTIARNENGTVTISADQTKLLLSPTATIYYTYGEENGSFTGTKQLTVAADATITAYAEADGYTTSENATRAVALFPEQVNTIFSASAATSGWSANTFSATTITASERTYATLLLDDAAWNEDVLLQTDGAWGLRSTGNWYINSNTANSWFLIKDAKAGDIVVTDVTYAPVETVNATYAEKYSFGGKHAFIVDADGNAEFAVIKPSASTMDYLYGVYSYRAVSDDPAALAAAKEALQTAIGIASNINPTGFADAISAAQTALNAEDATVASIAQATQTLEAAIKTYFGEVLPNLGAIVTALNDETLNTAYATAQTTLAKEDVTPQELATAMQGIIVAAQAVAPEHLENLKGYAVKYGATDAATLIDNALAAIEAGNVAQIITTMTAVKEAATPLAQTVLGTMKNYVEEFGLTDQAAQAQAALESGNYITMITTAKALFTQLVAAAKTYLPNLGAIVEGLNDATLNAAYADAVTLLAKESITPEELGTAMQNIITAAQAVAPEHLQNLRGYAVKYGEEDAVAKVDAAIAAIEAGNVAQIITTMTAVKEAATPLAQTVLGTMKTYVEQFGLTDQAAQAQAALESGNYITMITTAKALFTQLVAAAQTYLPSLKAIVEGLNDATLNAAYADAVTLLAKESITPEDLGNAMQNIITAAKAVAPEHLQNLRGYAVKYGEEDAVAKVDAAIAAIEAGNVSQIIATMTAVKEAATPLATSILTQMIEDAQNYQELAEDVTAAQTALESGNYITMIIAAKALYTKMTDYTSYIVNADLTGEGGFDATGTKGFSIGIVKVGNASAFDFKQTIANLPAGKYKVTAQAAYRYGADEAAEYAAINGGTDTKLVQLYATVGTKTVSTKVMNRWDGASETNYFGQPDGVSTVNEKFVPNSSDAVKAWFAAGQYVNEVVFNLPADGAVTIGINRTGTPESDYTVIGPWTLTRLGDAEAEPVVPELANADFEGEYTVFTSPKSDRDILKPAAWTVTYENGEENDMTALNSVDKAWSNFSGRPQLGEAGGNNTYWVRFRWGNSEKLTLSQEVALPAGTYKLSADAFFNGANGASATISAAGQSTAITGNSTWANHNVVFTVAEEGPVTIALNVTQTQSVENVAAFDNLKLESYDPLEGSKAELQEAITAAKAIETEGKTGVEELNAAITAAENALNDAAATAESLAAAKTALAAAIAEFEDVNITVPALAGWTRVRTANIENVDDNYYVLVDAHSLNYVMANDAAHFRPCYKTVGNPVENPAFVWKLAGADNKFTFESASTGAFFKQASGWNTSMGYARDGRVKVTGEFTLNNGKYVIKCVESNALVGHWNDGGAAVAEDGENIAANKQAKDAPGFYLFAMSKASYEAALKEARTTADVAAATKDTPVEVTSWMQNADFSNDWGGWENTLTSAGNMQWGQKTLEVWNASNVIVKQTLIGVPDGTYKLTADVISGNGDNKVAVVYGTGGATVKSDAVSAVASAGNYGTMSNEVAGNTLTADNIVVTGGVLTVGLDIAAGWIVADNFKLYYCGEDMSQYIKAYHDALTDAQAIDKTSPMNAGVLTALNSALTTYSSVDETNKETLLAAATALSNATEAATASIAAYVKAADVLPKMKELTESTNVYTAEAYEEYYGQWANKYEARTLTDNEANALQNPYAQTGWHDAITCDNFLLSAWDTNPDFPDGVQYYINTWSVEGNNDGTEFRVPFFEYWTGDDSSLGAKTMTASVNGLEEGVYEITAWVRVRTKNETGADVAAYGITLQANEGEAANVADGATKIALDKNNNFFLKEVSATGVVAEDGVLNIKFNVASDNNVSWIAFKNVKYTKITSVTATAVDDDYFTFSSEYPVDLANLPSGLKAYYVDKVEGEEAYVEEATGAVAAGTGLLLKAEAAGDYEIPVIAEGNAIDGNLLVGVQEKDVVASDATGAPVIQGAGYYVLIYDGNKVVFSQVNGEASVDLSKLVGKAYLYYAGSNAGKLRIAFPGEATAINSLDAEAQKSGKGIYNLSGQKVNAGYKGIVIVNGKKVMMK